MKTVLFVCTANWFRSRYAETYFNYLIGDNSEWSAQSVGFDPSRCKEFATHAGPISPLVEGRAKTIGISKTFVNFKEPEKITIEAVNSADAIVILNREEHQSMVDEFFRYPQRPPAIEYWKVKDVYDWEPEDIFLKIEQMIFMLVDKCLNKTADKNQLMLNFKDSMPDEDPSWKWQWADDSSVASLTHEPPDEPHL